MEVFEISVGDETFLSAEEGLAHPIETQILECNLYGKNTFMRNELFFFMGENGPEELSRIEMSKILIHSEDD